MLKYMLGAVAALGVATPAAAQSADWTGPYAGLHAGYTFGKSDVDVSLGDSWIDIEDPAFSGAVQSGLETDVDVGEISYGAQVGYNFLAGSNFLLGAEASYTRFGGDSDDDHSITVESVSYDATNDVDLKSMITLKARAGITSGNTLFYGNLGWAWVRARYEATLESDGGYLKAAADTDTTSGWLIGAGVEHRVNSNVSIGVDYSFTNQGRSRMTSVYLPGSTFDDPPYSERYRNDLNLHQIKLGVNFHF